MKDGWLLTGDLARMDEDGYFFIVDRKKDMIIRGGFNVYPREIEEVLYEHPAVLEAAVIAVPDEALGEEVGAAVVLRPGAARRRGRDRRVRQGTSRGLQIPAQHLVHRRAAERLNGQDPQTRDRPARVRRPLVTIGAGADMQVLEAGGSYMQVLKASASGSYSGRRRSSVWSTWVREHEFDIR